MKGFIKIDNAIFTEVNRLNQKEFFVWSFLVIMSRGSEEFFYFRMKDLIDRANKSDDYVLKYSDKDSKVLKLTDKRIIAKTLNGLMEKGYIINTDGVSFEEYSALDLLDIRILIRAGEDKFNIISEQLFKDYMGIIGYQGWVIYCYLNKNYNKDKGYSFPSLSDIDNNCNCATKTTVAYLNLLEEVGLIKIKSNKEYNMSQIAKGGINDSLGNSKVKLKNNEYIVFAKVEGDKYYIV